jgi:hypothetical protein
MTSSALLPVSLYTPHLVLALSEVSRGRIGATAVFSELLMPQKQGLITNAEPQRKSPGWYPAALTMRDTQLPAQWCMSPRSPVHAIQDSKTTTACTVDQERA